MKFANAWILLKLGYKIRRKTWKGYWVIEDNEIMIYTYDHQKINIRGVDNMMNTISNMAFDDWEIAEIPSTDTVCM